MVKYTTATLGFARIGPNRELKFALEKYWRKDMILLRLICLRLPMTSRHKLGRFNVMLVSITSLSETTRYMTT